MKMHLYRFSDGNPDNDIYLASTLTDEQQLRKARHINDNGGMPYDIFEKVWQEGVMTEITSLNQIPPEDLQVIPYGTDEWIEELQDYFDFDDWLENFPFNQ